LQHDDVMGERIMLGVPSVRRTPEDYRRFAEECLRLGQTTDSQQTRAVLLQMAQVWLRLAEQNEQNRNSSGEASS
jgi:hypothetical protein